MGAEKIDILLKEYELQRAEMTLRIDHRLRGITFFLSATVVALGLALKDEVSLIFLILPWFILGFFAFLGHQVMCAQLTVSYLKDIEERLQYVDYERSITSSQWHDLKFYQNPNLLLQIMSLVPFLLILLYSFYRSLFLLIPIIGIYLSVLYLMLTFFLFAIAIVLIVRGVKHAKILPSNRLYEK
jgi:hypothetical protein